MRRQLGRSVRGFSVLELSIAMAIAGIVVAAATTAAVNVTRLLKLEGKKSVADQDARRIVDFVVGQLQNAGGGPVRPWMATWLEEGCAGRNGLPGCNGHDRLTVVEIDPLRSVCAIDSMTSTSITFAAPDGVCCFAWPDDADLSGTSEPDQYAEHQLMLTNGRNTWSAVTSNTTDVDACTVALTGIMPLSSWSLTVPSASLSTSMSGGGVAIPVVTHTWYISGPSLALGAGASGAPPLPNLLEWVDDNLNGIADDDEIHVVFPGVVDFQVALGYDHAPENGIVVDANSNSDEWWGNAADTGTPPATALRMGAVGVVVGVKAVEPGNRSASVLNGTSYSNDRYVLRAASSKAMLRNIAVFY